MEDNKHYNRKKNGSEQQNMYSNVYRMPLTVDSK